MALGYRRYPKRVVLERERAKEGNGEGGREKASGLCSSVRRDTRLSRRKLIVIHYRTPMEFSSSRRALYRHNLCANYRARHYARDGRLMPRDAR